MVNVFAAWEVQSFAFRGLKKQSSFFFVVQSCFSPEVFLSSTVGAIDPYLNDVSFLSDADTFRCFFHLSIAPHRVHFAVYRDSGLVYTNFLSWPQLSHRSLITMSLPFCIRRLCFPLVPSLTFFLISVHYFAESVAAE